MVLWHIKQLPQWRPPAVHGPPDTGGLADGECKLRNCLPQQEFCIFGESCLHRTAPYLSKDKDKDFSRHDIYIYNFDMIFKLEWSHPFFLPLHVPFRPFAGSMSSPKSPDGNPLSKTQLWEQAHTLWTTHLGPVHVSPGGRQDGSPDILPRLKSVMDSMAADGEAPRIEVIKVIKVI